MSASRPPASRAAGGNATGLDRAVERAKVAERNVLHVGRQDEQRELAVPFGALDAAEHGRAREDLHYRGQGLLPRVTRIEPSRDVDGDHRPFRRVRRHIDRQVVEPPPSTSSRPASASGGISPGMDMLAPTASATLPRRCTTSLLETRSALTVKSGFGNSSIASSPNSRPSMRRAFRERSNATRGTV
jgi:hypothetical protein